MFEWLFGRAGRSGPRAIPIQRGRISARYDSAATTDDNRRHWANADMLAINAANTPAVRKTLRTRARYETANNSYAKGITLTLANDCIGTGPRIQMLTEDAKANAAIEAAFGKWTAAIVLAEKLRTMRQAKVTDGEVFGMLGNNPNLQTPVKLTLRILECDQVETDGTLAPNEIDGIIFDAYGNPATYKIFKQHPGSAGATRDVDKVPAASVIHYFRADRPGQARGIPEITPALSLFAQLRRFTLAAIGAAESAADFAMTLYTESPPNEEADVPAFESIELERKMLTSLPAGWKLGQTKAEQPTTTHGAFTDKILAEIARCLLVPFNVAAGNSAGYNYASGRLDFQTYFRSIRVEQSVIEAVILDRLFAAWFEEAVRADDSLRGILRADSPTDHQWFWDGSEHVDPSKEANAQETRLKNNTTTWAEEYAKRGKDWETEIRQRAKEVALAKSLGLPTEAPTATPSPSPADKSEEDGNEEEIPDADAVHHNSGRFAPVNGR